MLLHMLNVLLTKGITDFAVAPVPIPDELPYLLNQRKPKRSSCPSGLLRGRVLETRVVWEEPNYVGCGSERTSVPIPHKNGILVLLPDLDPKSDEAKKLLKSEHAHKTQNGVTLIVSHKAIWSPWSDYEPTLLERQRLAREQKERYAAVSAVADRLGVPANFSDRAQVRKELLEPRPGPIRDKQLAEADFTGDAKRWSSAPPEPHVYRGYITVPYALAKQLADELETLRSPTTQTQEA